ncbi:MAG: putative D,D-dipeptide transport system permease protein DdpC [Syntrophomonadaceae bacterium]|nr:putative D,D-dipeptide transport system permease protein DdpC [Bacillota bacterium]
MTCENKKRQLPLVFIGAAILAVFLVVAVFSPFLVPHDPFVRVGRPFMPPGEGHLLGTNDIGQDILSELIYGSRLSLGLAVLVALISTGIGTLLGLAAGFLGRPIENVIMRSADFILVLPFLPLVILLAAMLGQGFFQLVLVISVISWPGTTRIIRAQVLKIREKGYILNLQAIGAGPWYLLRRHILREVLPLVTYRAMLTASYAVLIEVALSFLGLGNPLMKSWGSMLYYAQARNATLTNSWLWWVIPPGLCIALLSAGFLLTGLYLETYANPRAARGQADA